MLMGSRPRQPRGSAKLARVLGSAVICRPKGIGARGACVGRLKSFAIDTAPALPHTCGGTLAMLVLLTVLPADESEPLPLVSDE
jgi:hypothetical protein